MKERGIIFSAWSIPRLLDGSKTMTRRVIKGVEPPLDEDGWYQTGELVNGFEVYHKRVSGGHKVWPTPRCPYGVPGDRLIVQEAYQIFDCDRGSHWVAGRYTVDDEDFSVRLTDKEWAKFASRKKPYRATSGRFMYLSLSRMKRELTDVRAERVQDISEEDARAEGVPFGVVSMDDGSVMKYRHPDTFARLWDSLHAKKGNGWIENVWNFALTFRRIET